MSLELIVDQFLGVWGRPGSDASRQLSALCHSDVAFQNPVVALTGVEALAEHVGELASLIGSRRLSRTTGLQLAGSWCGYGWALLPQVRGAELAGHTAIELTDGLISRIVSFHGAPPPRTFLVGSTP